MGKAGILLLCVVLGCSGSGNKLNEKTAAKTVNSHLKSDPSTIWAYVGRLGAECVYQDEKGRQDSADLSPEYEIAMLVTEMAGYLTETPDGPGFWKVALTDKGKEVLAAGQATSRAQPVLKGCDYQEVRFTLAIPELVKLTSITSEGDSAQVNYVWKWKTTDLGRALRQDGKVYAMMTQAMRDSLQKNIIGRSHKLPVPVPSEDFTATGTVNVRKFPEGWRVL